MEGNIPLQEIGKQPGCVQYPQLHHVVWGWVSVCLQLKMRWVLFKTLYQVPEQTTAPLLAAFTHFTVP